MIEPTEPNVPNNETNNVVPEINFNVSSNNAPMNEPLTLGSAVNNINVQPVANDAIPQNNVVAPQNVNEVPPVTMNNQGTNQNVNVQPVTNDAIPQNNVVAPPPTDSKEMMDDSFAEPRKKPIGAIIVIILLLLLAGGIAYYYFVLDNPKTIFSNAMDSLLSKNELLTETAKKENINFAADFKLTTQDQDAQKLYDVINQLTIKGKFGVDTNNKIVAGNAALSYKGNEFLNADYMLNNSDNPVAYAKLNDIFDKVIKFDMTSDDDMDDATVSNFDANVEDYKQVYTSTIAALKSSLENANYRKEIAKINGTRVKKISLKIDNAFVNSFCQTLLQDNAFLTSYAKITGKQTSEITDEFNKEMADATENDETIALYLGLIKNEFYKFEYFSANNKDVVSIVKEGNQYSFEVTESYNLEYQGYVKVNDTGNEKSVTVVTSLIEEELAVETNVVYSKDDNITSLVTEEAVPYEELTEEDMNKIQESISKNKALNELLNDSGFLETTSSYTESSM